MEGRFEKARKAMWDALEVAHDVAEMNGHKHVTHWLLSAVVYTTDWGGLRTVSAIADATLPQIANNCSDEQILKDCCTTISGLAFPYAKGW